MLGCQGEEGGPEPVLPVFGQPGYYRQQGEQAVLHLQPEGLATEEVCPPGQHHLDPGVLLEGGQQGEVLQQLQDPGLHLAPCTPGQSGRTAPHSEKYPKLFVAGPLI